MTTRNERSHTCRSQAGSHTPSQPILNPDTASSPVDDLCASVEAPTYDNVLDGQLNQDPGPSHVLPTTSTGASTPQKNHTAQDVPESCGHAIHPAYADIYISPQCPFCQFHDCLVLARTPALTITTRGGMENWRSLIHHVLEGESRTREKRLHKFVTGSHPRRDARGQDLHVRKKGDETEVSYSRGKTALLKKIADLEEIRHGEISWERRNPAEHRDAETQQQFIAAENYTAQAALRSWHYSKKCLEKIETQSATTSLKRGREHEIATRPDFPPPVEHYSGRDHQYTQEQRDFIAAATPRTPVPAPGTDNNGNIQDSDLCPPKRKRRCLCATVAFNPHAYIRSEADVDLLFAHTSDTTSLTPGFLEDAQAPPLPKSILRTAPQDLRPSPQREITVKALQIGEKYTAGKVARWRSREQREGYERVDTSGSRFKGKWDAWDAYREGLAAELGQAGMDVEDENEGMAENEHIDMGVDVEGIDEDEFSTHEEVTEIERQLWEAQQVRDKPLLEGFRPHGGMASAFALGSFVGGVAVEAVRRMRLL